MLKISTIMMAVFMGLLCSSCILSAVESDFYIANMTSYDLKISWIDDNDKTETMNVQANSKVLIYHKQLGEADDIPPTVAFKMLSATANINGADAIVYKQMPIDNSIWTRQVENANKYYIYTLALNNGILTVP